MKSHEWASLDGNKATVGITNYAQVCSGENYVHDQSNIDHRMIIIPFSDSLAILPAATVHVGYFQVVVSMLPNLFHSTDCFQFATCRADTESDQCCGNRKGLTCETIFMCTPSHLRRNWEMWYLWIYRNLERKSLKEVC